MQDFLVSWFGTTGATWARLVLAVVVVLALLLALRWVLKHTMIGSGHVVARSKQPRVAVLDVAPVDQRRRLVLIRRDNVEHLLLIGGPTDLVVEQTIYRGLPVGSMGRMPVPGAAPAQPQPAAQSQTASPVAPAPAAPIGAVP
ncbi:flagellar biosynthetic protein FliO, partial [Oharaeibacter diazotrophicus]